MNRLILAFAFAARKHRNQRRKDVAASPYINHPIELANVLANEARVEDENVLIAAILHDTVEDTDTTGDELLRVFGREITDMVLEVSDDKALPKAERKRLQVAGAGRLSHGARLVELADKICNLRDISRSPPSGWPLERQQAYFDWAKAVVDGLRGAHPELERLFDEAFSARPAGS
jgi:guanosine-3',5'-bis(diphosphate) 3'-pyrophosphohydrolase